MKTLINITLLISLATPLLTQAESETVNTLVQEYISQGATEPDAQRGREMWNREFPGAGEYASRSCASCHTSDLTVSGKHVKTGKPIEPMSPTVNPERLSSRKEIEKWFLRNCKWTLERECSLQEKADFLVFISNETR